MDFKTFSNIWKLEEKISVEDFIKMFDISNPHVKQDFLSFLGKKTSEKFDKEEWKEIFNKFIGS